MEQKLIKDLKQGEWFTLKPIEEPINVKEQKLTTPNRDGFVVVEWGGTEID